MLEKYYLTDAVANIIGETGNKSAFFGYMQNFDAPFFKKFCFLLGKNKLTVSGICAMSYCISQVLLKIPSSHLYCVEGLVFASILLRVISCRGDINLIFHTKFLYFVFPNKLKYIGEIARFVREKQKKNNTSDSTKLYVSE
jgi:hypothetical protein